MYCCFEKNQASITFRSMSSYYFAVIKQIMIYGSSVWVSTSVDNLNKVFRLQKHARHVPLNVDTRANSVDLLRELNWLSFFMKLRLISAH